jgi:acetylornithine/succinyldiaminopimelate/putrescine aminotransferase
VQQICYSKNILLIVDEIQTGMCRTGPLFAYEDMGFEPDIMTLAKGLGSGMPIGAVLAKEHCAVFTPGDHGSTFGGNPLATATGYAVTKYMLDNDLPSRVNKISDYLFDRLDEMAERLPIVREVRGKGLLIAVGLREPLAEQVALECLNDGLIVNAVRPDAIRLTPPLIVSESEVDEAVAVLEKTLALLAKATAAATFACPVCNEESGTAGRFDGVAAVSQHVATKAQAGDPDHFRWVDRVAPGALTRDATTDDIARAVEPVLQQILSGR